MLNDPLVALDFAGWFRRVLRVSWRNFGRLARLALVPSGISAVYLIALYLVKPSQDELRQRFAEAAARSGGQLNSMTAFWIVFGRMLPIMVVFMVLVIVASAYFQGISYALIIRNANGQPSSIAEGARITSRRLLPLLGWLILGSLIVAAVIGVPLLPGLLSHSSLLTWIGGVVAGVLSSYLGVTIFASVFGVVLLERSGIGRCFQLIKGRFWATFGRLLIGGLIYIVYGVVITLVVGGGASLAGDSGTAVVIRAILQAILVLPALVYLVVLSLLTYAELRFQENNGINTRALAAELTG